MISIIIPCYNGEKYLKDCLDYLLDSNFKDFEIIVVNDNSTDKSEKIIKSYQAVGLISNSKNLGPSVSRNKAAEIAQGDLLFFLDVDTKIEPNTLTNAVEAFGLNNKMGGAQAQLILGDTNKLDSAGHFLSPIGFPYETGNNQPVSKFNKKIKILGGKSAGLIIRKSVFDLIGGFDEDYFIYGEDTDLCWRVWLAGYQLFYLPSVKVRHFLKSSLNKETNYKVFYEGAKNNISNLIKNLSLSRLWWMLPVHIFVWVGLSLKQILFGKFYLALWIYKGIWWNIANFARTLNKRSVSKKLDKNILFDEISFKLLINKGVTWFKNV